MTHEAEQDGSWEDEQRFARAEERRVTHPDGTPVFMATAEQRAERTLRLYIVQAEEGSGIPGTPEVYLSQAEADSAYVSDWRDALRLGDDEPLPDDFDSDWPEDGGVRQWVVDITL